MAPRLLVTKNNDNEDAGKPTKMIQSVKDLSPDQKVAIESQLALPPAPDWLRDLSMMLARRV